LFFNISVVEYRDSDEKVRGHRAGNRAARRRKTVLAKRTVRARADVDLKKVFPATAAGGWFGDREMR
jgi:hypothetical protein